MENPYATLAIDDNSIRVNVNSILLTDVNDEE